MKMIRNWYDQNHMGSSFTQIHQELAELLGMLNREVKRLRMQCERLSLHKVQDRLLHLLETEGKQGRYPLGSGLKSLAGELGVTHEALYRCVSELEKKNCLRRDSGFLDILANGVKDSAI